MAENEPHPCGQCTVPGRQDAQAHPWDERMDTLALRIAGIEREMGRAERMAGKRAAAMRDELESAIDEVAGALFAFQAPRYPVDGPARRLKDLRREVSDLYARFLDLPD